jgi:Tol biopolymer transport system component
VSNNGTLVYVPGPVSTSIVQSTLEIVDRKGTIEPLKLPASTYEHPRVSPDGKHLAYVVQDLSEDNVWTYDLSGVSAPRRLTFGGTSRFPI